MLFQRPLFFNVSFLERSHLARFPAATDGFAEQMNQAVVGRNALLQVRDGYGASVLEIGVRHFHASSDGGEGEVHRLVWFNGGTLAGHAPGLA